MLGFPTTALLSVLAVHVVTSLAWLLILRGAARRAYKRGYRDGHSVAYALGRADQLRDSSAHLSRWIRLTRHFYPPVVNK